MNNQPRLVAIGVRLKREPGFAIKAEEKTLLPGEYSIKAFKRMYPVRYQNLVLCGLPSFVDGKITVQP